MNKCDCGGEMEVINLDDEWVYECLECGNHYCTKPEQYDIDRDMEGSGWMN
jgi:uncharacterized Zn finger protein